MRKLIGKTRTIGAAAAVYQVDDGLDIETNEQYDVVHRRLMFDDVLMVTIHREIGAVFLFITGALALFFLGLAIVIFSADFDLWPASMLFAIFGLPALVAFLTRLLLGVDVVTIFGKRSKASVRFTWRKKRAREMYGAICAAVRHAHAVAER